MNDKEYAAEKKRVSAALRKWADHLGIRGRYRMTYDYYTTTIPDQDERAAMTCKADWRYLHATIKVNTLVTKELDDEHLDWIACHEFMHVLLNEMREDGIDHEERVASELAYAFVHMETTTR